MTAAEGAFVGVLVMWLSSGPLVKTQTITDEL